jgi:hypothetical protein
MERLKCHAKDMSFNGVKDDIIYNSSITPYAFHCNGKQWDVRWDKGLLFLCEGEKIEHMVDEESFFEVWGDIQRTELML